MSREQTGMNPYMTPDYGATSSSSSTIINIPTTVTGNLGDFSPTEFIDLQHEVEANTKKIKQSWHFLERSYRAIGTAKDNAALRDKVLEVHAETNQLVYSTTKKMQRLLAVSRKTTGEEKTMISNLSTQYNDIVKMYVKIQQAVAIKMKRVWPVNVLTQEELNNTSGSGDSSNNSQDQLIQTDQNLQFENDMQLERNARIRRIEADLLDVNQIMKELSSLTFQQGEFVDTIENTIEHAVTNVDSGTSELAKAVVYQNRYRRKVVYLLIFAVILGVIVTGIIVSKLKS